MEQTFYRIVHLDAGRKAFQVASVKQLLDEMAVCGYQQLQFAFGNDGFRLLLDDMAMDGKDSDTVKEAVRRGNQEYNGDPTCLTQKEMEEILDYAREKKIEVVPMLNMPGHMTAALFINPAYRWSDEGQTSLNSIDVTREEAVAFCLELLKKYAEYFAAKGCRYFQFGADEYGNDIHGVGGLGFARLEQKGDYAYYASFLNRAAKVILEAGMTPRAFNDGFYYHEDVTMELDPRIEVCYWGKGWIGFDCAAVETIAAKGHPMINSHGGWYYVLKHENIVQKPTEHESDGTPDFDSFRAEIFPGDQFYGEPAGAMFCIWCDNSRLLTDQEVVEDAFGEMKAMAEKVMKTV